MKLLEIHLGLGQGLMFLMKNLEINLGEELMF